MEPRDVFLLESIIDFCDRITESYSVFGEDFDSFDNNLHFQDACAFRVMQIGEYVKDLSETFKRSHSEMPWHKIVGLRNILTHDYGKVSNRQFWTTLREDLPALREYCAKIISIKRSL